MVPIFNISSAGGSASMWLSRVLDEHPDIDCYHALRKPLNSPQEAPLFSREELVQYLLRLRDEAGGRKTVGTIHSMGDATARDLVLNAGGVYLTILRDPFDRINSLMWTAFQATEFAGLDSRNPYLALREGALLSPLETHYSNFLPDDPWSLSELEKHFYRIVETVFFSDMDNFRRAEASEVIFFERMVADPSYASNMLGTALQVKPEELFRYFKKFQQVSVNKHSAIKYENAFQILNEWPTQFHRLFLRIFDSLSILEAADSYEKFGYSFIEPIQHLLEFSKGPAAATSAT